VPKKQVFKLEIGAQVYNKTTELIVYQINHLFTHKKLQKVVNIPTRLVNSRNHGLVLKTPQCHFRHKSTLAVPQYIFPNFGNFGNYSYVNKCLARGWTKVAPN